MGLFAKITTFMRTLLDDTDASTARTTLGATTVGSNVFTLTNPGAITFLRMNADNTVTARSAANFKSDLSLGTAADQNTGTSGATIPFLNGTNTWSAAQTFTANPDFTGTNSQVLITRTGSSNYCRFMFRTGGTNEWAVGLRGDDASSNWLVMKETQGYWRLSVGTTGLAGLWGSSAGIQFASTDGYGTGADVRLMRSAAGILVIDDAHATNSPVLAFQAKSSTTNNQDRYRIATSAIDNTHASRKYAVTGSIYDTAARTVYYAWTDGSRGYYAVSAANGTAPDSNQPNNTVCFYRDGSNNLQVRYKNNSGTTTDINLGAVT